MPHTRSSRPAPTGLASAEGFCLAICHDLRAPLATAGAAMHELAREMDAPGAAASRRHLEIARRSLSKADELLGALPGLLAREPTTAHRVALATVFDAIRDDLDLELRLCSGSLRVPGTLPDVLGDATGLRIALRNLVQNAIRHRAPDVSPEITVRVWNRPETCVVTISDNGRGMDARSSSRGLGFGIGIVRRALEASGGALSFSSSRGRGTTAAVTLRTATASIDATRHRCDEPTSPVDDGPHEKRANR